MAYRLLVVDDDKDTADTIGNRLAKEGYEVAVSYDGEDALAKVGEFNPDVVILDLMLPKLNGFDVLKVVRERYKEKWRPVIIVSARTELEALRTCYALEADHYITKPFSIDDLLRGIKIVISLIPQRRKGE